MIDDDKLRLLPEMLTPEEIASLRAEAKETHAYLQKAFAHLRPKGQPPKTEQPTQSTTSSSAKSQTSSESSLTEPAQPAEAAQNWREMPKDTLLVLASMMLERANEMARGDPEAVKKVQAATAILDFLSDHKTELSNLSRAPAFEMLATLSGPPAPRP